MASLQRKLKMASARNQISESGENAAMAKLAAENGLSYNGGENNGV
jgi:hypothetical protein